MTKEQIIQYTVAVVIIPALNLMLRRYVEPIMPDAKKLISYMKKFLRFTLEYIFPIVWMIYLIDTSKTVDKYFVVAIGFCFSTLIFNILAGAQFRQSTLTTEHISISRGLLDSMGDHTGVTRTIAETHIQLVEVVKRHHDTIDSLLGIISRLTSQIEVIQETIHNNP